MINELIKLTEETVKFRADKPKNLGEKIKLEIKLPEGVSITSFVLYGVITACEFVSENGSNVYLLEMKICDLSPLNQKILTAYLDFLERDRKVKQARIDCNNLHEALVNLKKRFSLLADAVEEMNLNAQGMLELIRRNTSGKTTLH